MSDELRDLYQEVVIDHGKRPRNFRLIEGATHTAEGFNPLCGDQLRIYVKLAGGVIADIAFQGAGCAISQASASLMTQAVKGQTPEQALALFARVHALLTEGPNARVPPESWASWRCSPASGSSRCGSSAPPWPGTRCAAPSKGAMQQFRRSKPWQASNPAPGSALATRPGESCATPWPRAAGTGCGSG